MPPPDGLGSGCLAVNTTASPSGSEHHGFTKVPTCCMHHRSYARKTEPIKIKIAHSGRLPRSTGHG